MTERMAERVDDRLRLDHRELKRFGKTQSRWWKQRYNLGAISPRKVEETQIEALKRLMRSQRKCMAKRISFPQ